jgi:FkbM family methyltransferase
VVKATNDDRSLPVRFADALKAAVSQRAGQQLRVAQMRIFEAFGSHRYSSPGLRSLDKKVLDYLPTEPGVFLEIGANDGFSQSNTYYLERVLGWHGVLIEPVPSLFRSCRRLRKHSVTFNRACVGPNGPTQIDVAMLGLMSVALGLQEPGEETGRLGRRSPKTVTVPTATLSDLIDQAHEKSVDFMSVDVEGAELAVLSGLDLNRHTPGYLLVETKHPESVTELLGRKMEFVEVLSEHDFLYRRVDAGERQ